MIFALWKIFPLLILRLFLVDHNVSRDTLVEIYDFGNHSERKKLVEEIIDHHENEKHFHDI